MMLPHAYFIIMACYIGIYNLIGCMCVCVCVCVCVCDVHEYMSVIIFMMGFTVVSVNNE